MRFRTVLAVAGSAIAVLGVLSIGLAARRGAETGHQPVTAGAPAAVAAPDSPAWGEVIPTGIEDGGQERVFYVVRIDEDALPQTRFGVMAGRQDRAGALTGDVVTNEVAAADRADGFHAVWGGSGPNGTSVPAFGYYVGPAVSITATAGGRQVRAAQAVWSEDPRVVVFWFDNPGGPIADLAAFDARGNRLAAGDTAVYVG